MKYSCVLCCAVYMKRKGKRAKRLICWSFSFKIIFILLECPLKTLVQGPMIMTLWHCAWNIKQSCKMIVCIWHDFMYVILKSHRSNGVLPCAWICVSKEPQKWRRPRPVLGCRTIGWWIDGILIRNKLTVT